MVYEVCALVVTIILGVIGIELAIWLHSVRKLTDEARRTLQDLNTHLPFMLEDVQVVTNLVRKAGERVDVTVSEVAVSLEELRKSPLRLVGMIMGLVKQVQDIWRKLRMKEES